MKALLLLSVACGSEMSPAIDAGSDAGSEPSAQRVVFVVQNSNSMTAADPELRRKTLLEEAFVAVEGDVRFAVIVFSDGWRDTLFTSDPRNDPQTLSLLTRLEEAENLSVLDGALRRAKELIDRGRAEEPDPSIRWSVVILTDGFPKPTCTDGNDINPICETPRAQWGMFGVDLSDASVYYGYAGEGAPYNRREDAIARVTELGATAHAILLYSESLVGTPAEQSLALNRMTSAAFVEMLAATGQGSAETRDGRAIDWSTFLGN